MAPARELIESCPKRGQPHSAVSSPMLIHSTNLPLSLPHPEQAWFWTQEWQAGKREADRDSAAGLFITKTLADINAALNAADA